MIKSEWWKPVFADFVKVCKMMGVFVDHDAPYIHEVLFGDINSSYASFIVEYEPIRFIGGYEAIRVEYECKIDDNGFEVFIRKERPYYIEAPVIIREHFPDDEELHRIVDELCFLNQLYTPMYMTVNRNNDYGNKYSMYLCSIGFFDFYRNMKVSKELKEEIEASFLSVFQDLAKWYDKKLKEEYNRLVFVDGKTEEKETE